MTPAARKASLLALLGKTDWTNAPSSGIEQGKLTLSLLSLDQSQALAAHPDQNIAARAKALLAKGGGLPRPGSREDHPGAGAHRPEGWRCVARQGDLQEGMHEVPCALGRGGQGRP